MQFAQMRLSQLIRSLNKAYLRRVLKFAKALAALAPERAGYDFMEYIAQASIEDLRQLNQTSINVYTCIIIFRFSWITSYIAHHRQERYLPFRFQEIEPLQTWPYYY